MISDRFTIEHDDGTICRLVLSSHEGDEPGQPHQVALLSEGIIGNRETVAFVLERIHRLYPKSEFAPAERKAA